MPNWLPSNDVLLPALTLEMCGALAVQRGYAFFGTQAGNTCFGGSSLAQAIALGASAACTAQCAGSSSAAQICGGTYANSVYEVVQGAAGWMRVHGLPCKAVRFLGGTVDST